MKKIGILMIGLLASMQLLAQQGTIDYKMTMTGNGAKSRVSSSKMMFSGGKVRVETNMSIGGISQKQVMLMVPDNPNSLLILDEKTKTYREISTKPKSMDKATVKVIGKEKIQNLNCTHVVVTIQNRPMDMWTTKDIDGYQNMLAYWKSSIAGGNDQMYSELKKVGAEGFVVKTQISNPNGGMTMELVKYDDKPVAAAVFEIPSGYKKGASFDPEKMKNMTPAERRKAMEEMMKQYGKQQ